MRSIALIADDLDIAPDGRFPTSIRTLIRPTHRNSRYDNGEDRLYSLGDDDESTDVGAAEAGLRSEHIGLAADAMMAHSDTSRGAPLTTA